MQTGCRITRFVELENGYINPMGTESFSRWDSRLELKFSGIRMDKGEKSTARFPEALLILAIVITADS